MVMKIDDVLSGKTENMTAREKRLLKRQALIYNTTEDLLLYLESNGIFKQDLASELGKSRSFITQVLSGARNMTLGTLSDICFVLGLEPSIRLEKDGRNVSMPIAETTTASTINSVATESAVVYMSDYVGNSRSSGYGSNQTESNHA